MASETLKKQMAKSVKNIYRELGSWAWGCRSRLQVSWAWGCRRRLQVVEAAAKLARYTGHNDNIFITTIIVLMVPSASQLRAESAVQHILTDRADERRFLSCCFSLVGTGNQKGEVHRSA